MITVGQYCALLVVGGLFLGIVMANIYVDKPTQITARWRRSVMWQNAAIVCAVLVVVGLIGCVYVASGIQADFSVQSG